MGVEKVENADQYSKSIRYAKKFGYLIISLHNFKFVTYPVYSHMISHLIVLVPQMFVVCFPRTGLNNADK